MSFLHTAVETFLHLDKHLAQIFAQYGTLTYLILFAIVFVETGLVVFPFLPGDSLLFAAGILAGGGSLSLPILYLVFFAAAFLGDNTNYFVGKFLGPRLFREGRSSRFLKREHLDRTRAFFERYGGKTVVIARFVPIVRTFAPFVAGLGAMRYGRFITYSIFATLLWVGGFVTFGYKVGNNAYVREHFSLAVVAVVLVSLLPALVEFIKHRRLSARPAV